MAPGRQGDSLGLNEKFWATDKDMWAGIQIYRGIYT